MTIDTTDNKTLTVTKAGTFTIGLVTAATDTYAAGAKVTATLKVSKGTQSAPAAPAQSSKTDTTVTLTADSAMEFSNGGASWQTSNAFSGLSPNTEYAFYQRLAGNDLDGQSASSLALSVTTDKTAIIGTPAINISGTQLQVGAVLTADTDGMTPTTGYTYQWKADGAVFDDDFTLTINGNTATKVSVSSGTAVFTYSFPALSAKAVSSIAVTTQPTTIVYYSGDTLDLSGLVIKVDYDDTSTDTLTYPITRAEFAVIMIRALGLTSDGDGTVFGDVSASTWYAGAVGKAYEYCIVAGNSNDLFAPERQITRQEAMLMIQRAAQIIGFDGKTGSIDAFPDTDSVASWTLGAALWNVGSGLVVGSNGMLHPLDNITRAETATLVLKLLQKAGLVDVRTPLTTPQAEAYAHKIRARNLSPSNRRRITTWKPTRRSGRRCTESYRGVGSIAALTNLLKMPGLVTRDY